MKVTIKGGLKVSAFVLIASLFPGCSEDLSLFSQSGNTVIVAEAQPIHDTNETRTAYDNSYTDELGVNWTADDQIGVFSADGSQQNVMFKNTSSSESAATSFSGNFNGTPQYAYYPYSVSAGSDLTSVKGSLPQSQQYSSSERILEADWKVGTNNGSSSTNHKFTFEHLFAFLRFEVNASGSPVEGERLESISLTIPGTQLSGDFTCNLKDGSYTVTPAEDMSTMTMKWSDTPELKSQTFYGFMTCFPVKGISGRELTITVNTSSHTATFKATSQADAIERNKFYTLDVDLKTYAGDESAWTARTGIQRENAEWKPGLESKLACANTVFGIPGKEFMHKIRVADSSQSIEVYNLPEGLKWNAKRKLVYGTAPAAGDYVYSVEVKDANGNVTNYEGIKLLVRAKEDLAQPTPHMGWQSWNVLEKDIDATSVKEIADAMVNNGFKDAGYIWLGIDDCWQDPKGTRTNGVPDINTSKWPNGMKDVTDYIHSKGLKAGIYSDAGTITCASGDQAGGTMLGAYGYETETANAFVAWGFDKLKEDWFWSGHGDTGDKVSGNLNADDYALARDLYTKMGTALQVGKKDFLLSMCEWGTHEPWKWGSEAGASSWRMSYDARDGWLGSGNTNSVNDGGIGLKNSIVLMRHLWPYVGINRFNDADMLCVGIRGTGRSSNDLVEGVSKHSGKYYSEWSAFGSKVLYTGMSDDEYETNFAMWCMWSSPLLITCDIRKTDLNQHDLDLLKNTELIDINQDPLAQGAEFIKTSGNVDYYMKDLAGGDVAIVAVNLGDSSAGYSINFDEYDALDKSKTYKVRECLHKNDIDPIKTGAVISGSLNKHACIVYRLSAQ